MTSEIKPEQGRAAGQASRLPWYVVVECSDPLTGGAPTCVSVVRSGAGAICEGLGCNGPANVAFIVEACNGHARLLADVARLEKALKPFAELGERLDSRQCHFDICRTEQCVRCSKVLAARAALSETGERAS